MRGRKGRLAKLLSLPVLVVCGFVVAATMAGVGLATVSSTTTTTTPETTSTPETTTTTTTTTAPPGDGEGCTPGFWKNHPEAWEGTGFAIDQTLGDVFDPAGLGAFADVTLLDALSLRGGSTVAGAKQILLRHAVAALLNSASLDFGMSTAEVIAMVDEALASNDREEILAAADVLAALNEAGCPLS
jgi:hypothetical protein